MKKLIASAVTVLGMVAVVAGGTYANFTSLETVSGNTVTSGNLDLNLGTASGLVNAANPIDISGIAPGESRIAKVRLRSDGSIDISSVKLSLVRTGNVSLFNKLQMRIWRLDDAGAQDSQIMAYTNLSSVTNKEIAGEDILANGGYVDREIEIFLPADADDKYQNITTNWNMNFVAYQ